MNEFKCSGTWWLPNSQKQVMGDLTFSNKNGIQLDLHELLDEGRSFPEIMTDDQFLEFPIILGRTKDGKLITLCDCAEVSVSVNLNGGSYATYDARVVLINAHFTDTQEMRFHRAQVQYDYLPDFVRKQGFTSDLQTKEGILKEYQLTYKYPPKIVATTSRGEVSVSYTFYRKGNSLKGLILQQSTALEIKPREELTLNDIGLQYLRPLQDLISLATNRANSITDLLVYSREKVETGISGTIDVPIKVAFQQDNCEKRQDSLLPPFKLLFTLNDEVIVDRFSEIVERWLTHTNIAAKLKDVFYLYFSTLYDPDLSLDMKFLSIAFAAELYHRRGVSNEILPNNDHKARIKAIVSGVPQEYRRWLNDALLYSNEPRFRNRVDDLVEMTKPVVAPLFSNKDYFVKKVKDTRNYLVHKSPNLQNKAAEGEELYWLTKTLSYVVQTCLLMEVGLTSEDCFRLFSENREYQLHLNEHRLIGPYETP
jgi:ApeA N-terminal domain 1/Apea-like HEPN